MSDAFDIVNPQVLRSNSVRDMLAGREDAKTFLMRMVNLSDDGVFHDDTCPICRSPFRSAGEKEWSSSRNADVVRQIFLDKGEKYSVHVVKNHMDNHFGASGLELRKREYIERLSRLGNADMSTMAQLDLNLNALQERLVAVNALQDPELPDAAVEKIRTDLVCKIISANEKLLQFRANMLGEMRQNGEVFTVDKKEFTRVFSEMLKTAGTENEQVIINMVFTKLLEICKEY